MGCKHLLNEPEFGKTLETQLVQWEQMTQMLQRLLHFDYCKSTTLLGLPQQQPQPQQLLLMETLLLLVQIDQAGLA